MWLQNPDRMSAKQWREFAPLRDSRLKVARAWAIKEAAMLLWGYVRRGWAERMVGVISFGGLAFGVFSFGGASVGLASVGGLAIGIVSLGGAAIGLLAAVGGVAIGYNAVGATAIGVRFFEDSQILISELLRFR
jgi:hypothetical protein